MISYVATQETIKIPISLIILCIASKRVGVYANAQDCSCRYHQWHPTDIPQLDCRRLCLSAQARYPGLPGLAFSRTKKQIWPFLNWLA